MNGGVGIDHLRQNTQNHPFTPGCEVKAPHSYGLHLSDEGMNSEQVKGLQILSPDSYL